MSKKLYEKTKDFMTPYSKLIYDFQADEYFEHLESIVLHKDLTEEQKERWERIKRTQELILANRKTNG